jgi:hypothetical protein
MVFFSAVVASCDDRDGQLDGGGAGASRVDSGRSGSGRDASTVGAGRDGSAVPRDGATLDAARDPDAARERDAAVTHLPERCTLPRDGGDCDGLVALYYYDVETRSCQLFAYGGCGGNDNRFLSLYECETECRVMPQSDQCWVTAVGAGLPGVSLLVEGARCRVLSGHSAGFAYSLEVEDPIAYQTPDSGGSCGRCKGYSSDPHSLIDYAIGDGSVQYCECDVGCCAPTTASSQVVSQGEFDGLIDWPGRAWQGPSDTNEPLGDPFPPGDYHVTVAFVVPGVGSVTARLPIEVVASPSAPVAGASCEVGGVVYADGEGGIADPQSCNTCSCRNGELACTEIACHEPCPDGMAFGTSCSQCGPADGCEVVRTACLPTCSAQDDCDDPVLGFCGSDGKCKNVCG